VRRLLAVAVVLSAAFGVGLTAWAGGNSDEGTPAPGPTKADEAGGTEQEIHGGPIERLHAPGPCDLVSTAGLPGNWTHGDYVTAVEGLGNATLVVEAAHSGCGKPMKGVGHGLALGHGLAVGQGLGPPGHALEHGAKKAMAHPGQDESSGS
jgi:hypothetical protein